MRRSIACFLVAAACGAEAARVPGSDSATSDSTGHTFRPGETTSASTTAPDSGIIRGLYVNRFAAQSPRRMRSLMRLADTTEINAFVIDIKDEFGLNYRSEDSLVKRNAGNAGAIPKLRELLDSLEAHGVITIARIVVFKDSVAARVNPAHTMRKADGKPWRDKQGLAWVNPYDPAIWEYNIRVAEEMARLGFDEIQFDYIRFPEPYRSLPPQHFPGANGRSKQQALAEFLKVSCGRIRKLGALCTADIFGLVTTVPGALEIGQHWETLAPLTDVLLPMVYPSHYPKGSFGVARPNADPYTIVYKAISRARERNRALGITDQRHVRAWLQAFSLGRPTYGPLQVREQKRAVYDAGFDDWVLWHPGSLYDPFIPGLERKTVSRRKTPSP
ncbi:MAG: putative glycoside hydrolase [Gemmatimonadaceae bacterium]